MFNKSQWTVQSYSCCNCHGILWNCKRPGPWRVLSPENLAPSKSESVLFRLPGEKTVTTRKTSEILGLWFVWSIITPARNLRNHHLLCLHVFTSRENYSTLGVFLPAHLEWRDSLEWVCCVCTPLLPWHCRLWHELFKLNQLIITFLL